MTKLLFSLLITVVFWNLENFFDWKNDGYSQSDADFSSRGTKYWTYEKCRQKALGVGKTLLWAGLPDIVGVAEVENARVMGMITHSDALRKYGYAYVHFDSRDRRGIDVALMYRRQRFDCLRKYPVRIVDYGGSAPDTLQTRDILHVVLRSKADGSQWHIFVNHHPSKLGGAQGERNRMDAMSVLRRCVDSVLVASDAGIVAMGDFNDTPDGPAFDLMQGALINLGAYSSMTGGSIRHNGLWELIDNYLVDSLTAPQATMEVLAPAFLLERDKKYPGLKPRRTYIGPRYNGGLSDHLPVRLNILGFP